MVDLLITGGRVLTEDGALDDGWLRCRDGTIVAYGSGHEEPAGAAVLDAGGTTVAPGYIDVHVHGAVGHEAMDADPDGLREMARFFARHGVTAFLPTTWTAPESRTLAVLEAIAATLGPVAGGATVLGAHMEGPYLSAEKCGAQDPRYIRPATSGELERFLDTGAVRLMTVSPQGDANLAAIPMLIQRGVTVSVGHTSASFAEVNDAVDRGATHATHLYNAMSPLHHREPGTVGAVLSLPALRAELVCDGVHVHPGAIDVAWAAKGPDGIVIVTDSLRPTGLPAGRYAIDDRTVRHERGAVWLEDGTTLAGSALTFDRAVRNLQAATGEPIEQLWPALSRNAARAAGVGDRKGSIAAGKDADVVLLDAGLEVEATVIGGAVAYQREGGPSRLTTRDTTAHAAPRSP